MRSDSSRSESSRSESSLERSVCRLCKARGVWPLKAEMLFVGFPDRVLLAPGGRVAFWELKTPAGELRKGQKWAFGILRRLGFRVEVIRSNEEAEKFLEDWL